MFDSSQPQRTLSPLHSAREQQQQQQLSSSGGTSFVRQVSSPTSTLNATSSSSFACDDAHPVMVSCSGLPISSFKKVLTPLKNNGSTNASGASAIARNSSSCSLLPACGPNNNACSNINNNAVSGSSSQMLANAPLQDASRKQRKSKGPSKSFLMNDVNSLLAVVGIIGAQLTPQQLAEVKPQISNFVDFSRFENAVRAVQSERVEFQEQKRRRRTAPSGSANNGTFSDKENCVVPMSGGEEEEEGSGLIARRVSFGTENRSHPPNDKTACAASSDDASDDIERMPPPRSGTPTPDDDETRTAANKSAKHQQFEQDVDDDDEEEEEESGGSVTTSMRSEATTESGSNPASLNNSRQQHHHHVFAVSVQPPPPPTGGSESCTSTPSGTPLAPPTENKPTESFARRVMTE